MDPFRRTVVVLGLAGVLAAALAQGSSLDLPSSHWGLSLGNSREFTGLRVNLIDRDVATVNGINLTLWIPEGNAFAEYNGVGLHLVGAEARRLRGLFVSVVGTGVQRRATGIFVNGLGMGAGQVDGLSVSLLGTGCDDLRGIAVTGLGLGAKNVDGFAFSGLGLGAQNIRGICLAGLGIGADSLKGLAAGAYIQSRHVTGLTIGLVNRADMLHGVQIGVVNYAGNNPRGLRWLPGINAHF